MVHEFDLQIQQELGRGTFFQVSYLGSLGRELPNFLNLNLNPTTVNTNITVADPTGKGPLPAGSVFSVPTYTSYGNTNLFGSAASHFQSITEFTSNINSSYNAFVMEVQNNNLKLVHWDANYTWAHALDYAQNANTQGTALNWYDPYGNAKVNYGNSNYNIGNRFVAWAIVNVPNSSIQNFTRYITNDWSLSNSFQMGNGLPYSLTVSGFAGNAILSDWNGASGATFIPQIGRNTFTYPRRIVDDIRVQKQIPIKEGVNLQLLANFFNMANHQNIDSISSLGYKMTSAGSTQALQPSRAARPAQQPSRRSRTRTTAASSTRRVRSKSRPVSTSNLHHVGFHEGGGFGRRPFSLIRQFLLNQRPQIPYHLRYRLQWVAERFAPSSQMQSARSLDLPVVAM